jgi:hypothetical protein
VIGLHEADPKRSTHVIAVNGSFGPGGEGPHRDLDELVHRELDVLPGRPPAAQDERGIDPVRRPFGNVGPGQTGTKGRSATTYCPGRRSTRRTISSCAANFTGASTSMNWR